ncbi:MAG: bifunctional riboflavin kinase/FAD synthetase [Rickettsiales bacterium]|nr:bifunctional riboflavin kinase/FAD synthetase [Rickettsiales bacterium]
MQIIKDATQVKNQEAYVCALGNFDGLHYGHMQLLKVAANVAKAQKLKFAIMTFEPHPVVFFSRSQNIRILSLADKIQKFRNLKADLAIIQNFNQDFANLSAEYFLTEILLKNLNVRHIVIGHDFIFGKNRKGDADFLNHMTEKHPFGFTQIPSQSCQKNGLIFSSTEIRKAITTGNVRLASELMGDNFSISGKVIHGNQIGKELGYQTANLALADYVRPKHGVYAVIVKLAGVQYKAIANFGLRPTLTSNSEAVLEIHIFNFNQEIYDAEISVEFIDFIRDEKKFASKIELTSQIAHDCEQVKKILEF